MPQFLRIPWIQWNRFRVGGEIREKGSQRPLAGLCVRAFDKDLVKDDFLGEAETDAQGRFDIRFTDADFKDFLETRPDLYLCVFVPGQTDPIVDTSCAVRENANRDERFEIEIPASALPSGI